MGISHTTEQHQGTSFSVDVLKRILTVLSENGKTKKTSLAGKTGLNYVVCVKYVNFMKMLGWIEVDIDSGENERISVTRVGRQVGAALSDFLHGKDFTAIDYSAASKAMESESASTTIGPLKDNGKKDGLVDANRPLPSLEPSLDRNRPDRKGPRKILLIDDEPDIALTYKSFLSSEGYQVDAFREPERAIEHFISSRPSYYDLVVTDIRMHEINGLRLFQVLKIIDPSIKVIFVTALDAAEELVSVLSPEPVRILRKPVDRQVFSKYVKSVLQE